MSARYSSSQKHLARHLPDRSLKLEREKMDQCIGSGHVCTFGKDIDLHRFILKRVVDLFFKQRQVRWCLRRNSATVFEYAFQAGR